MDGVMRKIFFMLLTVMLAACVPESEEAPPISNVNFTVLGAGSHTISGVPENRRLEVFRDQTSFSNSLYLFMQPIREQTVDFSTKQVVLLSLGDSTGGGIGMESIDEYGDHLIAHVVVSVPGQNCIVVQVISSPYQFVEVDSVKKILFSEKWIASDCLQ